MLYLMSQYECFKADRRAVTALEYGVIAAVIIGVVATVFSSMGGVISTKMTALNSTLQGP